MLPHFTSFQFVFAKFGATRRCSTITHGYRDSAVQEQLVEEYIVSGGYRRYRAGTTPLRTRVPGRPGEMNSLLCHDSCFRDTTTLTAMA
eukprot:226918-Rhodomonas_salina.2